MATQSKATPEFLANAQVWLRANRAKLRPYRGQWIAFNGEDGLLAHHKNSRELLSMADSTGRLYILKFLFPNVIDGILEVLPARRFRKQVN